MKIAIQASDLDHSRIDGTRVYILNLLKYFGQLDKTSDFLIYHKNHFNPELKPPSFPNYKIIQKYFPFFWTQTRFAFEIWKDKPDVLWMPMQALLFIRRKNLKTVITIHDLAFKYFPDHFPKNDLRRLNLFTDYAIRNSTKIIAVSQSTKNDILKFFPEIKEEKIKVIYHGFDANVFQKEYSQDEKNKVYTKYQIQDTKYILYIGAIQPRKNLKILIQAFNKLKSEGFPELKLVIAGEAAWLAQETQNLASESPYSEAIIMPGRLKFDDLGPLMSGAGVFVLPSLYEGFGIPILEAMAAQIPVISANNSSLKEVGGEACLYFRDNDSDGLSQKIKQVLEDNNLRENLIRKGNEQIKNFSWEKCARETLEFIKL
jgi:glycosyltransferase involved in cell wall biosynthesis